MDEFLKTLADLSAAAAAIITILTLLTLLGKGVVYGVSVPERVRRRLYKPRFVILPTPEEVVKYCVKNDNALFLTDDEWIEELKGWDTRRYQAWVRKSKERIALFYYATYAGAALLIGRLLTYTWKTGQPENLFTVTIGAYLLVGCPALLGALMLQPRRQQIATWKWSNWRGWNHG
ncbi:hypothetical protein GHK47_31880 [Sinorhizobium meliloti]|uniref:hypothetical protein n=1 Tax=Rhizobium meliloti TaxID=382 RepID=UPI001295FD8C|nr:hypothetical protein [Sinorhizobium meliloti]MQV37564.1 hypothetical protein [Sinorhizobium meliloti]